MQKSEFSDFLHESFSMGNEKKMSSILKAHQIRVGDDALIRCHSIRLAVENESRHMYFPEFFLRDDSSFDNPLDPKEPFSS